MIEKAKSAKPTIDVRSILRQQGPNLTDTSIDLIVAVVDNKTRRLRGDQIEVFKTVNGYEDVDRNMFFKLKEGSRTRGHKAALVKEQCSDEPIPLDTYSNKITVPKGYSVNALYRYRVKYLRRMEKIFWEFGYPMRRKDIFYNASVTHLEQFRRSRDMEGYIRSFTALPNQDTGEPHDVCIFSLTLAKTLLGDKVCFAYCVTSFLCMTGT
ncbi:hypothetical protein LSAT2_031449 [Lamellibrachia satsuma]|nr:hypothetical protein LSAT2_031449 [Lamellibrachia satsuma]